MGAGCNSEGILRHMAIQHKKLQMYTITSAKTSVLPVNLITKVNLDYLKKVKHLQNLQEI